MFNFVLKKDFKNFVENGWKRERENKENKEKLVDGCSSLDEV